MKIDAHHHFWRYDPGEYGWINDSMAVLRRDFLPGELRREIDGVGINGVVSVQARQTLEETRWLLGLAAEHDFIRGVVGWVPLAEPDVRRHLDALADRPALKGIRHIVQDEPDDSFLLRDEFNAGVDVLTEYGLAYDILIYERQLPQAVKFVDRHLEQVFVLDHLAKPRVKEGGLDPWRTYVYQMAKRDNVYCKLSGLATEADWNVWSEDQLAAYVDTALEAFGPRRMMFGSDWPVCLLACSYARWYETVKRFCSKLTATEQERIFGGTAVEAYRL